MAVVQISKIQVRRGLKNSGIGVPQLSSAEFAWAVDTQELFIGNGSIAEGSPYVGNTKILTEHDNILDLASSYRFGSNDTSINLSVSRSLQTKLDEEVSVFDYGAVPDGNTDNSEAFQNALNELFRNSDAKFKKVLVVPNGIYNFEGTLFIPSTAIIRGETQEGAVLNIGNNNILFITSSGDGVSSFTSTNRPSDVNISNITIRHDSGATVLTGLKDSTLDGVRFVSDYILGDSTLDPDQQSSSLFWENTLPGTKVSNINLKNCKFENTPIGARCLHITVDSSNPPLFDTYVNFTNCEFFQCDIGIFINGVENQGNIWNINDCRFEEISQQALRSDAGTGTKIFRSQFINCGNGINSASNPLYAMVSFAQVKGNVLRSCSSNRIQEAGLTTFSNTTAISDVIGSAKSEFTDFVYDDVYLSDGFRPFLVLSAENRYTVLEYRLKLNNHVRYGHLVITVDETLGEISYCDNYTYSTPLITSSGGALMTNFEFQAELRDNDSDSGVDTVLLSYRNPLSSGSTGNISFSVSYGV